MQIKHTEKPPKRQSKPHPKTNLNAALKHAKAGLSVFPARPTNKRPYLKGWQDVATTSEAKIRQWWAKWPDAVPALPTGKKNGIAVMDIDRKNGKDGYEGLRKLGYDPRTLSELQCATPSGGAHLYFKWRKGMGNSAAGLPVGVDVRGEGGFVIAPGAVTKSGRCKPKGMMLVSGLSGLQKWPKALRPKKPKANAKSNPTGLPLNVLRSALMAIPNNNPDRDWWLAKGAALHFETGGSTEGLTVWHEWSTKYGDYDHCHTEQVWHSFKRQGGNLVTGKTILAEAQKHGWRDTSLLDYLEEDIKPDARIKSGVRLLSPDNCAALPPRDYLVKGLIAPQNICCIFGDPGAGKSLIGLRLDMLSPKGGTPLECAPSRE